MDRREIENLFSAGVSDPFYSGVKEEKKPKKFRKRGGKRGFPKSVSNTFRRKLEDEMFDKFNANDWRQYFYYQASANGYHIYEGNRTREIATIKGSLKDLEHHLLKSVIDFIWESDHDLKPKGEIGVWILSRGWRNTLVVKTKAWINGEEYRNEPKKQVREWKKEEPKPSERKTTTTKAKPKPKRKITIGGKTL